MTDGNQPSGFRSSGIGSALAAIAAMAVMSGCEVNGFLFDQTKTGRFEHFPTMIPVLDRIDVIEQEEAFWARATPVMPEDLVPRDLEYTLYPGDVLTVYIFDFPGVAGQPYQAVRRIDAAGNVRIPDVGDVRAAGLTPQQFEDRLGARLLEEVFTERPQVDVVVEQAVGLRYTIYGFVAQQGMFTLQNPDLRLIEALAIGGGVPTTTERVYVIRTVPLTEEVLAPFDPQRAPAATQPRTTQPSVEDLIEQLEQQRREPEKDGPPTNPPVSPGMVGAAPQNQEAVIDIDDLQPVREQEQPPIDIEEVRPEQRPADDGTGDTFIYVEERGEWVRVRGQAQPGSPGTQPQATPLQMVRERVIEVDYKRLAQGDSSQNLVVRPGDRIYVVPPPQGLVYIEGEVARVGTYELPVTGTLTLSRAIAAAGGFGPIAEPNRIDLVRRIGRNREAVVRLDLAAIRQRTEPDVVVKPDDHIIVGTSFWATPMAVIRSGFRATYGFGFLLDRNFGSDVFGIPPGERGF